MAVVFHCNACGRSLTRPLKPLDDPSQLSGDDMKPHVPKGFFVVSDGGFYTGTEGELLINLDDSQNTRPTSDHSRLNGCCGRDGCDGPNTLCQCGAEVGTERSDCWMPTSLSFLPATVSIHDEPA